MKYMQVLLVTLLLITITACKQEDLVCDTGYELDGDTCVLIDDDDDIVIPDPTLGQVYGLEDVMVPINHYFHPLGGVLVENSALEDITHYLSVEGHVDYGTLGIYELTYTMDYNGEQVNETRTVTVSDMTYTPDTTTRSPFPSGVITGGSGSYYSGTNTDLDHPINPGYIPSELLETAVPSTGWWTSLLAINQGGGNGIYTNPMRISYTPMGMEITNPEDGFVQYWNVNGDQTIAQFPIALQDTHLMSLNLQGGYETHVIDYGDAHVKVAMRNPGDTTDHMVTTLVQGSPYVFVETADREALTYRFDVNGVLGYEYYDTDGNQITGTTHTGDGIVVKLVQRHSGYDTSPPANVGSPQYSDKFYLVNTPDNTTFNILSNNHPFGGLNFLELSLGDGNQISIATMNDLSETEFYHTHGYYNVLDTDVSFDIDYDTSMIETEYTYTTISSTEEEGLVALMPHHYKNADLTTTEYRYRTVRGTLEILEGNTFTTSLSFHGLLPGFTLPTSDAFDTATAVTYLNSLNDGIDINDEEDFINYEGPYWNGKAIYPLAQGLIIASQLGEDDLATSFIGKLRYILEDWYTYSGTSDEKFLYYNNAWGSVYYSNDDFGTATHLSDHSFTHGYLIYASSVLAMYDPNFINDYGEVVELLLNDYMYPEKDDERFEYLRNFDPYAGHSWAHGFGTFAEGNNLESTSEALNSWNGGYLWALATGDEARMEAAIYGFATELSAIKEYWFDYEDTNWDPDFGDYVDVAGMIWGGKHDYATWFGANPTFIYGIHWLPTGEFLTNYAMDDTEYAKLSEIYATYLDAKNGTIDTWYSNMWAIQSIIDPSLAINQFDANLILNDDYPNELIGSYWMIHALDSLNRRTTDIWMEVHPNVASSIYQTSSGSYQAMIWNPTGLEQTVSFHNEAGEGMTYTVSASTFETIELIQE